MSLPCVDCITLPICQKKPLKEVIEKCSLAQDYLYTNKQECEHIQKELNITALTLVLNIDRVEELEKHLKIERCK